MRTIYDEIAIASYSFHKLLEKGMIDIYGYLESLRYRYHILNADIWNGYIKDMDEAEIKKVRFALDDRGLSTANLCCDWAHPWADDPDELRLQNEMALKMLRYAEILGAKSVRIDLGVHEDDITDEQFEYVSGKFAEYARIGGECGFRVGPENHWGASRRLSVQKRMYEAIRSPHYGMLLHLGNWLTEDGISADETNVLAAPMAFHTHVDFPTSSKADILLPKLRKAGYGGVWGVEHHLEINEYHGVAEQLGRVMYAASKMREEVQ